MLACLLATRSLAQPKPYHSHQLCNHSPICTITCRIAQSPTESLVLQVSGYWALEGTNTLKSSTNANQQRYIILLDAMYLLTGINAISLLLHFSIDKCLALLQKTNYIIIIIIIIITNRVLIMCIRLLQSFAKALFAYMKCGAYERAKTP